MKKLFFILLSLILVLGCDTEPLDASLNGNTDNNDNGGGGNDNGGSDSSNLALSVYELDTNVVVSFFGTPIQSQTNSDLSINDNKFVGGVNAFSVNNSPFSIENQTITRDVQGKIVSDVSVNSSGTITNQYIITYDGNNIASITYDYYEDDVDDFQYNFVNNANTILRTEFDSTISTQFTLDNLGRIIQKESFDGTTSILKEVITYASDGNIATSVTTGELSNTVSYTFDTNTNPLKVVYEDNYLLQFLADDYDDEVGMRVAHFISTNNWTGVTINDVSFDFQLNYNTSGRISSRTIAYDFGPEFSFQFEEQFTYLN